MKKSLTALLLCMAGLSSNANANIFSFMTAPGWDSNWLVGAKVGVASAQGPFVLTVVNADDGQNVYNRKFHDESFMAGLLAGYQARCGRWLAGLELNADWRNLDSTHDFADTSSNLGIPVIILPAPVGVLAGGSGFVGSVKYERNWALGLSARFGYAVANYLMPYIRLGVETSDDELSVSFLPVAGTFAGSQVAFSESDWTYRLFGGFGIEMPFPYLMEGLSVRAEYDYYHRGQGVTARTSAFANATGFTAEMKQRNQTGTLALVWNFG